MSINRHRRVHETTIITSTGSQLPAQVLEIANHQGSPTIRTLGPEAHRGGVTRARSNSMQLREPDASPREVVA